ncbi:MAG TPA: universal stress protein [Conexibacter sp.]|nr:universal stress protein [Conexibacter sp.]
MANVLVVANDTHGGRSLIEAIKARAEAGDAAFVVIAPQNKPQSGMVIYDEAVRDAARHRVDLTLSALRDLGIEARGDVMDPDPFSATLDAVREYGIDEIIISTHPETRSGWMRRDLIERVQDATALPVQHVVVDLDADRAEATQTLVIANRTAGGEPLFAELKRRATDGPHRFTVVVPQDGGQGHHAAEARERLSALLDRLHREGIPATGGIGDPDPFTAVMNALQFYRVDEIVISTLPRMRSRWLRSDLVERVKRATACPVEHVVVELAASEADEQGAQAA